MNWDEYLDELARQTGLSARYLASGVGGLGSVFAEPLAYSANKGLEWLGSDYRFPAQYELLQQALTDIGLPEPQGALEKGVGFASELGVPDPSDSARIMAQVSHLIDPSMLDDMIQLGMTVFHGSPHKWDKVDLSKVGTGEGAQAYGHGFYVAENPGVAKGYADELSRYGELHFPDGEMLYVPDMPEGAQKIAAQALIRNTDPADARYAVGNYDSRVFPEGVTADDVRREIDLLADRGASNSGHLYELDLPDSTIDKMLDWDKPLSEQPESVLDAIVQSGLADYKSIGSMTGRQFYERIAKQAENDIAEPYIKARQELIDKYPDAQGQLIAARTMMTPDDRMLEAELSDEIVALIGSGSPEASRALNSLGIPGIKYLDGTSRSAGEGTRNFVVFDESYITPLKRNGEEIAPSDMLGSGVTGNTTGYGVDDGLLDRLNRIAPDADASISQKGDTITLNKITIPKESRSQGVGGRFMDELTKYADDNGLTVVLTADGDFGGSKAGQQRFYKRHGFVNNSGRNKDYAYTENMIRRPITR